MEQRIRVFVGSSQQSIQLANAIKRNLEMQCDATIAVWDEDTFKPNENFLYSLITEMGKCDFGVFVFSPDDTLLIEGDEVGSVRDNVLFEFGLFVGTIGAYRTFAITPRNKEMRIASDLKGIHLETYSSEDCQSDEFGKIVSATKTACSVLASLIKKRGKRDKQGLVSDKAESPINSFLAISTERRIAIVFHCDDPSKYFKFQVDPTGRTLDRALREFSPDVQISMFTAEPNEIKAILQRVTGFDTIYVVDSPPYNPLSDYVLKHYESLVVGGYIRPIWMDKDNRIDQRIRIERGAPMELASDKFSRSETRKTFDKFQDYAVIMRLPDILSIEYSQPSLNKQGRTIWVIYGIHTKGTHAAVSALTPSHIDTFLKLMTDKFGGSIPMFFEAVGRVPEKYEIVENPADLDWIHVSRLRLRTDVAMGDDMPPNLHLYFSGRSSSVKKSQVPVHAVHLDLCAACNFECPHCIEKGVRQMGAALSFQKAAAILCDLHGAGCRHVSLYGGEPTLHPDLPVLLRLMKQLEFTSLLVTNGSQLDKEDIIESIADYDNLHLRVSIDAHTAETHRRCHGLSENDNSFARISEAVARLLERLGHGGNIGARVSISYLLHEGFDVDEIIQCCGYWRKKGAHSFHLRPVTEVGGMNPHTDSIWSQRFSLQHIMTEWPDFVVVPEWLRKFIQNDKRPEVSNDHFCPQCFSAYYRFTVSPFISEDSNKNVTMGLISGSVAVPTDDAWISLCAYRRYDTEFGCVYPNNFNKWLQTERLHIADKINPMKKPCRSTVCNRQSMNAIIQRQLSDL